MLKNIVGAVLGAKILGDSPKADSATGAATGAIAASAVPFLLSRLSLPAMLVIGAGGYFLMRRRDKNASVDDGVAPSPKLTAPVGIENSAPA